MTYKSFLTAILLTALISLEAPAQSPAQVSAEADRWPAEAVAERIEAALGKLAASALAFPSGETNALALLSPDFQGTALLPPEPVAVALHPGLRTLSGAPAPERTVAYKSFGAELRNWLKGYGSLAHASFKITDLQVDRQRKAEAVVLYELVGLNDSGGPRQDQGRWKTTWLRNDDGSWLLAALDCLQFSRQEGTSFYFQDVTASALGQNPSFNQQLNLGIDYWARRLDAASGIDFYGLEGIAVGDSDNDGWEDLYVCQSGGLPNRLFRNRGNGTFEDVTQASGLAVLDATAAALWADYDNDGDQDLFLLGSQVLLFENDGKGGFARSEKAKFQIPSEEKGSMMGAAMADYDRDGFLDLYVCQYSPAGGSVMGGYLSQPTPYHDANNGPPNQLFRNNGDGTFSNVTAKARLSANNHRWSFAAAWGDYNDDGYPDVYVANDFGRNNLYRNNRNGTFTDVAAEAGVEDIAAGMSACWEDYDNDAALDLYVSNIWSAAGQRLTAQDNFQSGSSSEVRRLYQRFTKGNTLYRNKKDGTFEDTTPAAGVENGGWAWASDFFDFNNDGWEDLYVVNGYITNDSSADLESFQWRNVAANSPPGATRSKRYDEGWRTFQHLMRESGLSTHAGERKRFYLNTGKGTFVDVSASSGADFKDDGRAFAIVDFDNDGDLDLVSKNRTAPQIRVLRNQATGGQHSIAFELVGARSNRDAVGTKVTLQLGNQTRIKQVESGSGFLSQHTRRVYFGLGNNKVIPSVRVDWPSGASQEFNSVAADRILRLHEGQKEFSAQPFHAAKDSSDPAESEGPTVRSRSEAITLQGTWLLERMRLPDLEIADADGNRRSLLRETRGRPALVNFWRPDCEACRKEWREWRKLEREPGAQSVVSISVGGSPSRTNAGAEAAPLAKTYFIKPEALALVSTVVKHLFVRRSAPGVPLTMLLDPDGYMVKVYRDNIDAEEIRRDLQNLPRWPAERVQLALPFAGQYHREVPGRQEEYFWIGYDFLHSGFHDEALAYFEDFLKVNPRFGKAFNNIGTIHLRKGRLEQALAAFRKAWELEPGLVEVQFNIGTALAMKGQLSEAVMTLEAASKMDPGDAEIWNNLGNAYLNLGQPDKALAKLEQALELDPKLPMAHNNLGIIYGERGMLDRALKHFEEAVRLQPDLHHAYLNLGIIYLSRQQTGKALEMFLKVQQLDPANQEARRMIEQLQRR